MRWKPAITEAWSPEHNFYPLFSAPPTQINIGGKSAVRVGGRALRPPLGHSDKSSESETLSSNTSSSLCELYDLRSLLVALSLSLPICTMELICRRMTLMRCCLVPITCWFPPPKVISFQKICLIVIKAVGSVCLFSVCFCRNRRGN